MASFGIARLRAARCRLLAGAAPALLASSIAACGSAAQPVSTRPVPTDAPAGASGMARGVARDYAALRRPVRRTDAPGAAYARAQLSRRFDVDFASARRVAVSGVLADRIYLVSADDAVCIVSSARLESGCDALGSTGRPVTARTIICSPYLPTGMAELYGSVPDGAGRVRVRLRDDRVLRPILHANLYRYYWAKHRRALPRTVLWRAEGTEHAVDVPLPTGRGWLGCGPVRAP